MSQIKYIGEDLWIGQLGHGLVLIAFAAAIFSSLFYLFSAQNNSRSLLKAGRGLFWLHTSAVVGIFALLLYMLFTHQFEYQYAWQHSSKNMSMKYILACLWEGQEGSFLLWLFWHCVLGLILQRSAGKWEAPVMAVIGLVQIFLASMLLGVYIGDVNLGFTQLNLDLHIGSNPFLLVREVPTNIGLPWTQLPDYLTNVKSAAFFADGRGLNPLLQNYWMVIHPPTLFLGFALTVVPFAFAIAALWKKEYYDWQKTALPWTFTGIGVLGTGILMGGAWAYEALSFGGFWAWDPVENASLVPWLTLVGAGHVMLIHRLKGRSLFTTFFLCIISFLLILYSTFLTRSGILGETSVHSFTDLGMTGQLILYLAVFVWLAVLLLSVNLWLRWAYSILSLVFIVSFALGNHTASTFYFLLVSLCVLIIGYVKFFPKEKDEEALWSREFWMFCGALVLFIAASQITFYTSTPVANKFLKIESVHNLSQWLFDTFPGQFTQKLATASLAPSGEVVHFYNKWQLPFGVLLCLLIGAGQFFKYRQSNPGEVFKKTFWPLLVSAVIGVTSAWLIYFNRNFVLDNSTDRSELQFLLGTAVFVLAATFLLIIFSGAIVRFFRRINALAADVVIIVLVLAILCGAYFTYRLFDGATDLFTPESGKAFVLAIWCPLLLFASSFAVLANADYVLSVLKGKIRKAGASLAHIGFGLLLLGALVSTSRKQVISRNVTNRDLTQIDSTISNESNILITQGDTLPMGEYHVTYSGKEKEGIYIRYNVDYYKKDEAGKLNHLFRLQPFVQLNERMGNAVEPDTKHYLHKDVYTHIVQADLSDPAKQKEAWSEPQNHHVKQGDTIAVNSAVLVLDSIVSDVSRAPEELSVGAVFSVYDRDFKRYEMRPYFTIRGAEIIPTEQRNDSLGLKLTLWKVDPKDGSFDVYVSEKLSRRRESIVMKAVIFPGINILWLGCLIMVIGTGVAVVERLRRKPSEKSA